jgi:glycosyltransferase involved in cell wall biosynthesis
MHVMQVAGAEMLVAETIRRLGGRIDPVILCLDGIGALGETLQAEGHEVICLHRRPGRDWKLAWRLADELRRRRIEVIHAHQYTPFFYSALARVLAGLQPRLIFTEHGRHFPDTVSRPRRLINRLLLARLASAVHACCGFSARALAEVEGFSSRHIEVIENGIQLDRYTQRPDLWELKQALGLSPSRRYIACVARFHPVKDHATLLRAFARVAETLSDVDLLLAGDGPLREELQLLAGQLNIQSRVSFLGVRSDVPVLLQAVDLFALTSVSEAASLTLLEAMAAARPVVVTAVGGNPEIVRHGREGFLVPRGDVEATAAALLHLLEDPAASHAMGAAGRARVEERYRLERTVESYSQLYQRLTGREVLS